MKRFLIVLFVSVLAFSSAAYAYNTPPVSLVSGFADYTTAGSGEYWIFMHNDSPPTDTDFPFGGTVCANGSLGEPYGLGNDGHLLLPVATNYVYCDSFGADGWYLASAHFDGSAFHLVDVVKLHNSGTDTSPVWSFVTPPFLGFPLSGLTPYTAGISGVVDHSVSTGFNCSDGAVTAYTGEQGVSGNGESNWSTTATGSGCSGSLYGLAKASGTFSLGGQYDSYDTGGTNHNVYLFYDGHTGYDYPAANFTPVNAAAGGTVYYHNWGPNDAYHDMKVVHGNGYTTYYLHLSYREEIDGTTISKGTTIGKVGSNHLHFTVKHGNNQVDPYGWTGTGADPLQVDGHDNICLWDTCP